MASPVELQDIRNRARRLADMENSTFVTDSDINQLINTYVYDLQDKLIDASPPHYSSTDLTVTITPGTIAYALPTNFRNLIAVYAVEGTNRLRPLRPIQMADRLSYSAPSSNGQFVLRYIPTMPALTLDTDTLDGVAGWDELIVCLVARDMMTKEESDVSALDQKISYLRDRIDRMAKKRSVGFPTMVQDVRRIGAQQYPYINTLDGYDLRGGFIDLFSRAPYFP